MSQPSILSHASDVVVFTMLKHNVTGGYVGHEKFEQLSKDALVKTILGSEELPSVVNLRNHFIEEVDISWLRDVAPRELVVVSAIGHAHLNREPR